MGFPCPACEARIDARPERFLLRCPSCRAVIRCRPVETSGGAPAFLVQAAGRGGTPRRVEVPWDEAQRQRLSAWLLWSSVVTVGLVLVLYALARLLG